MAPADANTMKLLEARAIKEDEEDRNVRIVAQIKKYKQAINKKKKELTKLEDSYAKFIASGGEDCIPMDPY